MSDSEQTENKKRKLDTFEPMPVENPGHKGCVRMPTCEEMEVLCLSRNELYYFSKTSFYDVIKGAFAIQYERDAFGSRREVLYEIAGVPSMPNPFQLHRLQLGNSVVHTTTGIRLVRVGAACWSLTSIKAHCPIEVTPRIYENFLGGPRLEQSLYPAPPHEIEARVALIQKARFARMNGLLDINEVTVQAN